MGSDDDLVFLPAPKRRRRLPPPPPPPPPQQQQPVPEQPVPEPEQQPPMPPPPQPPEQQPSVAARHISGTSVTRLMPPHRVPSAVYSPLQVPGVRDVVPGDPDLVQWAACIMDCVVASSEPYWHHMCMLSGALLGTGPSERNYLRGANLNLTLTCHPAPACAAGALPSSVAALLPPVLYVTELRRAASLQETLAQVRAA